MSHTCDLCHLLPVSLVTCVRCYLRLGHWEEELKGITDTSIPTILEYYHLATQYDRNLYKVGCHAPSPTTTQAVGRVDFVFRLGGG